MRVIALALVLMLSACSTVKSWVPSFWDDNQSAYIVDARIHVAQINCDLEQKPQVLKVQEDLLRFEYYSSSKGALQADVLRVVEPIKKTVDEWVARGEGSKAYCTIKKKLLTEETARAASVILGRW